MRNAAIASVVLLLILLGVLALALRNLPPTLPSNEPLSIALESLEQVSTTNNISVPGYTPASGMQGAWGVFHVSAINHGVVGENQQISSNGNRFYADDGPGGATGQITGIFYGLQTTSPTTWTGGTIDLFWHASNAAFIDGNCISGTTCKPDATAVAMFTAGTFIARLKFASGIDPANPVTFRISDVPFTTLSTTGGRVVFSSFASVDTSTTLAWTNPLDRDFFNTTLGTRDVRLMIFANGQSTWSGTGSTGLRGNDPIFAFTRQ